MVLLSGCELPNLFDKPDEVTIVDPNTVYVQGLSFARAPGFQEVKAADLVNGAQADADAQKYAASLGMDKAAFIRLMSSYDLYLIDRKVKRAYPDNISVSSPGGAMPDDKALASQFAAIGATRVNVDHVKTDLGEVTTATFMLRVGRRAAYGEVILVDHHGPVVITASSSKPKGATKLAKQILDSLEASASPFAD